MVDVLNNLFREHFATSVIITVLLVVGLIWLTTRLTEMWIKVKNAPCKKHEEKLDAFAPIIGKVSDLPCEKHEEKFNNLECNRHENNYSSVKTILKNVETSIETLKNEWMGFNSKGIITSIETLKIMNYKACKWIMKNDIEMIDEFDFAAQKQSPLTLTEAGRELLERSFAKKTMDSNFDFFMEKLEAHNPQTPYDVEEYALEVVFMNTGNEIFNDIKNFLYYSPEKIEFSNGVTAKISLQTIIRIMGLYLRDKYLKKYPEIEKNVELTIEQ